MSIQLSQIQLYVLGEEEVENYCKQVPYPPPHFVQELLEYSEISVAKMGSENSGLKKTSIHSLNSPKPFVDILY